MNEQWGDTFVRALRSKDPEGNLVRAILSFKEAGGTQTETVELLAPLITALEKKEGRDAQIVDMVICCVGGYCNLSSHLFAEDFDEEHFYRKIQPSSGDDD